MTLLEKLKQIKEKAEEFETKEEPTFVEKMEFVHKNLDEYRMMPLDDEEIQILNGLIEGLENA